MSDSQFVQSSSVDFLIPQATDLDIEEALGTAVSPVEGEESSVLARIPQRSLLYFDEAVSIYVILRTPYRDDQSLQKFVPRLNVVLEAMAFSSPTVMTPGQESQAAAQARDIVWTSKLDVSEDPVFVVVGSGEDEDGQDVLLIWKISAFIARPKVRLQAPAIIFRVSAMLRPPPHEKGGATEAYLPSGVPFATNVLEPLGDELLLSGSALASGTTASSQASVTRQAAGENLPLHIIPRRAFRAIPAISSRIRYHRANGNSLKANIIATLELDALKFGQHAVDIQAIRVTYVGGEELRMLNGEYVQLPLRFEPTDNLTCLYSLDADDALNAAHGSAVRTLDVAIDAQVVVSAQSHPKIEIRWRQNVDLTPLASTTAARGGSGPSRGSIQRDNRPSNLSISAPASRSGSTSRSGGVGGASNHARGGGSRGGPGAPSLRSLGASSGVSATFTRADADDGGEGEAEGEGRGTGSEVAVGGSFSWDVSVVNRSGRLRQFALAMLPKRPGVASGRRTTRSTTLVGGGSAAQAEAVVDDNVLYATIKQHAAQATQLVCLSADARTGVMPPQSVFELTLQFMALSEGMLAPEAIRVTDLETGEAVDVADLPDVMAVER